MNEERVFAEPWEAQAFALAVALNERGAVHAGRSGARRSPPCPRSRAYYERWLATLEQLVIERG